MLFVCGVLAAGFGGAGAGAFDLGAINSVPVAGFVRACRVRLAQGALVFPCAVTEAELELNFAQRDFKK